METQTHSHQIQPPKFDGSNYQIWAVQMEVHLQAIDLWEIVEEEFQVPTLGENPTAAQIKTHKEKKTKKAKAMACLYSAVSPSILPRIMKLESPTKIWNYLQKEYEGNERVKHMRMINLLRQFEMQKMNNSDAVKAYVDKLLSIVDKVRLLGKDFPDERVIEKILVTLPEKYEITISSLENAANLSSITLAELLNALQAFEQRKSMREEDCSTEAALLAKSTRKINGEACPHCKKTNHPHYKCWWRPDVKCSKCGQMGHVERVCKDEGKVALIAQEEETLF